MDSYLSWNKIDSFAGNFSSPVSTMHRPCPVCGSIRSKTVLKFDGFQFFSDSSQVPKLADVRQVQCLDCFALYMNPCYSESGFSVLFAEAGRSYGSTTDRVDEQVQWLTARNLVSDGGCLLDVGCGDGRFLAGVPGGIRRIGVDIDAPSIQRGQEKYGARGIELIQGDFASFRCPVKPDLITMYHLLEHLSRPLDVLRGLRTLGHAGTRLLVEVPVLENETTADDINGFFSVQHMTHFTRSSLVNCLARAGWLITDSHELDDYNGYRILAQPGEPSGRISGNREDFALLARCFSAWYAGLAAAEKRLASLPPYGRYVIWGGGFHTELIYQTTGWFHSEPDREYVIVDSDPLKHGKGWRGIAILPPSILEGVDWDSSALLVSSYSSQEAIASAARNQGVPDERIFKIYECVRHY